MDRQTSLAKGSEERQLCHVIHGRTLEGLKVRAVLGPHIEPRPRLPMKLGVWSADPAEINSHLVANELWSDEDLFVL